MSLSARFAKRSLPILLTLVQLAFVECCSTFRFKAEEGVALFGHVIKNITTDRPIKCQLECANLPKCMSINTRQNEAGTTTCEMSKSSKAANPQDLKPRRGFQYQQMIEINHCTTDICYHREALPDNSFRFGSKFLKFFPERKTWGQAQNICQALGGRLVTIQSEHENEFIFEMFVKSKTNLPVPVSSEVLAHWPLDGTDLEVIRSENGSTYIEEDGVKSLFIDGSQGAHATTPAVSFGNASFTIAVWLKLVSPVSRAALIYADPGHWSSFGLAVASVNQSYAVFLAATPAENEVSMRMLAIDEWNHIAGGWDPTLMSVSVNGNNVTQKHASNRFIVPSLHSFYDIGFLRATQSAMRGQVRDLTIFSRLLSDKELEDLDIRGKPAPFYCDCL